MSRFLLYVSSVNPYSNLAIWLSNSLELKYDTKTVESKQDMVEIQERNPNNNIPVLQDGDLILTEPNAIFKYISALGSERGNIGNWPGLGIIKDTKLNAKIDETLGFVQTILKPTICDYLESANRVIYDTVPDNTKINKLDGVMQELNIKKKGHQFMVGESFTIADIYLYGALYKICHNPQYDWKKNNRLEGWYRVVTKIVNSEWNNEKQCSDVYETDSDDEDYQLAETIFDCVRNDRADILDQLAKEGANINMPLAVVEAVNRGNLAILKVMRDHNCYLKWPMAITMAKKLAKGEEILALLFGPGQSPEERNKEIEDILNNENKKMRVALGLPEEPTGEELKKMEEIKSEQGKNQTVGGMPSFNLHNNNVNTNNSSNTVTQEVKETVKNEISQNNPVSIINNQNENEKETDLGMTLN